MHSNLAAGDGLYKTEPKHSDWKPQNRYPAEPLEVEYEVENGQKKEGSAPGGPTPASVSAGGVTGNSQTGTNSHSACTTYMACDARMQDPVRFTDAACQRMRATVSAPRLSWYMEKANGDLRLALRLHAWKAAVAGSLLPTLHQTEVAIRNFAARRLRSKYGKDWYQNVTLERRLGKSPLAEDLRVLVAKASASKHPHSVADQITSDLTFGFWVNVFTRPFRSDLWLAQLHTMSASMPRSLDIDKLHGGVDFVRTFRNNVAHHKNVVRGTVEANYERTLEVLGWFCRDTSELARETATFPAIWACCPLPKVED